jgi:hypothetical protein
MEVNQQIYSKEELLLQTLNEFYNKSDCNYIDELLPIVLSKSDISLRGLDWFVTNYSKKYNTHYLVSRNNKKESFDVHNEYKAQLKAFNKKFFDPFCRGNKIIFPYFNAKDKQLYDEKVSQIRRSITNKKISVLKKKELLNKFDNILDRLSNIITPDKELSNHLVSQLKGIVKMKDIDILNPKRNCLITTVGQLNFFKWAVTNNILKYVSNKNNLKNINDDMTYESKRNKERKEQYNKEVNINNKHVTISAVKTVNKYRTNVLISFE